MVMPATLMLPRALAVASLLLAVAEVCEYLLSMLVGKHNLFHQPAVHDVRFELGTPTFSASGMTPGNIPGKIGVGESGDSHRWRWKSSLWDWVGRWGRCSSATFTVFSSGLTSGASVAVMPGRAVVALSALGAVKTAPARGP